MIRIRPYKKNDEKEILDLDAKVLPSDWNPRKLDNWNWKFTSANPAGRAFIWLAEFEGGIIAHFAAVPFLLNVFGDVVKGSHTIGALVEERYQNRGLLKLVADKLWEDLREHNVPLTWGFPNQRAYALHKLFLGYQDLVNLNIWERGCPFLSDLNPSSNFRPIKEFNEDFNGLWKDCLGEYKILVVRDKKYLNWKYKSRPDWSYSPFGYYLNDILKGYVVLKLFRKGQNLKGHIIDIFASADDRDTFSELIAGSLIFFAQNKVDQATIWIWGSGLVENLLAEKGFRRIEETRPLVLRLNSKIIENDCLLGNSHWYFTMGDSTEIF